MKTSNGEHFKDANRKECVRINSITEKECNGAPVACTVTVQATYIEHRVRCFLETSRTRIVQRKVLTREKGKSRTVIGIVNLLSINSI